VGQKRKHDTKADRTVKTVSMSADIVDADTPLRRSVLTLIYAAAKRS
jgi:hypothetical protein